MDNETREALLKQAKLIAKNARQLGELMNIVQKIIDTLKLRD